MKAAVLSDSHDNLPNLRKALEIAADKYAETIIHAGDIISPFAAKVLASCGLPVHAVFGNNDGEKAGLASVLDISEGPRLLELSGKRILLAHAPDDADEAALRGCDVFIHGHTHQALVERRGGLLVLNPGETGGWLTGKATFALLDLETLEVEPVEL